MPQHRPLLHKHPQSLLPFPEINSFPGVTVCTPEAILEVLSHRESDKSTEKAMNPHLDKVIGESLVMAADSGTGR
jgi:hypothetical protein